MGENFSESVGDYFSESGGDNISEWMGAFPRNQQVIAPRRTLMRRSVTDQRLTSAESDAAWRPAHTFVRASYILNGSPAATMAWLTCLKLAFADRAPVELMETSVGSRLVEQLLQSLDWGDVA